MARAEIAACAGAILLLPDGRWVMQRRTDDAPGDPDMLSFFGGSIEEGETPEQGLEREIDEETSIDLKKYGYALATTFEATNDRRKLKIWLYWVHIPAMDFAVYEGKHAEAYHPADLAKRSDISKITAKALQMVTETKHGA